MRFLVVTIFTGIFLLTCSNDTPTARQIVDKAIDEAGGSVYESVEIEFDFRDKHYSSTRHGGNFEYRRESRSGDTITIDSYGNQKTFKRLVNQVEVFVPDSMATRYKNSINSVNYFLMLPYGLNDAAVNKELVGSEMIKGTDYYKIKITFDQEGGGQDFEDVFIYWIDKEAYTIDYLAYEYHTNDGGMRFRQAFNPRRTGGIRFVDYYNFKPESDSAKLDDLGLLFEKGELKLLSTIATENIMVKTIN